MKIIKPGSTIGIIGGGQLGRMSSMAASSLGYKTHIFTNKNDTPASEVSYKTTVADYTDEEALKDFAENVDVITYEFENIPHESVKILESLSIVNPCWKVLHISQNRLKEKTFINSIGVKTAKYKEVAGVSDIEAALTEIGSDCILKTVEEGYDGKGQFVIDKHANLSEIWKSFPDKTGILEGKVDFEKEVSVIVAKNINGEVVTYSPVENKHKDGILDITIAPAEIDESILDNAKSIAIKIADEIGLVGMLAVEMFLTTDNKLLINEIAPRPHNSGHWTIDACVTSQFEQFIRAVCGLPFGSTFVHSKSVMKNLIGDDINSVDEYFKDENAKIHIYGKKEVRKGRKMAHVTTLKN